VGIVKEKRGMSMKQGGITEWFDGGTERARVICAYQKFQCAAKKYYVL
jgi:hypothetical protein